MSSPRPRPGFTLVELLVVIAIIGILAAIVIPAIYSAVGTARGTAIATEIAQMEMAFESYKNANNDYPPNFFENYEAVRNAANPTAAWSQTVLFRHLRRVSRSAGENLVTASNNNPLANGYNSAALLGSPDPSANRKTQIDAAESLVFWLGGLSKSATSPTTGGNGPLNPTAVDTVVFRNVPERETAFFEFKEDRLTDLDEDGIPEYVPPHGERVPYVYFDSRSYDNLGTDANTNNIADDDEWAQYPLDSGLVSRYGAVRPYVVGSNGNSPVYANDEKFQILCAGMDGLYGAPGAAEFATGSLPRANRKIYLTEFSQAQAQFPFAIQYVKEDLDNLSNFSGGVFEDQMP